MTRSRDLTDYEREIVANVHKYGCHVTTVVGSEPADGPPFTYSTGLIETTGQPEVILLGLSAELQGHLVNDVLQKCRDGLVLEDWVMIEGLLEGYPMVARVVHPTFLIREYLNSAMWYEKHRTGRDLDRVVQLVWPDLDRLFPWDDGCDEKVLEMQPALYERRPDS